MGSAGICLTAAGSAHGSGCFCTWIFTSTTFPSLEKSGQVQERWLEPRSDGLPRLGAFRRCGHIDSLISP